MTARDPIRTVDRRKLGVSDISRVTSAVRQDLVDMRRALKEKFGDDFVSADFTIPSKELTASYASNVRAWLFNESRRTQETIVDLTSGAANKAQVIQWIRGLNFNRGVLDLSLSSHPRAVERSSMWEFVQASKVARMGMIVPRSRESSLSQGGLLQGLVGQVKTPAEWQQISRALNRDRAGMSLIFSLGLHHGDFHRMVPITSSAIAAALVVMARYRSRVIRSLRRRS